MKRTAPAISRCVLAFALAAGFSACESVRSTAVFYEPLTAERFPPKPRAEIIPVFREPPPEPHRAIGRMQFEVPQSFQFVWEALQFNARENGADGIVLLNLDEQTERFLTRVPPRVRYYPTARYYVVRDGSRNRLIRAGPAFRPFIRPGYWRRDEIVTTSVEAEMFVLDQ